MKTNKQPRVMRDHRTFFMLLGFISGILFVFRQHHPEYSVRVHYKIIMWQMELAKSFGITKAAGLASRIRRNYFELMSSRPEFESRVLQRHLDENILPGLALYQVLQDVLQEPERVREWTGELLLIPVMPRRFGYQLLGRIPGIYEGFSFFMPKKMQLSFPDSGWDTHWMENSEQRVSFQIHTCFYLDVLTAYGVPELTSCFCRLDDVIAEDVSPFICWKRDGTLAGGNPYCDFQYEHVRPL